MIGEPSSVLRLYHPGDTNRGEYGQSSGSLPQPPEDTETFTWNDLEEYKIDTTQLGEVRSIEDITQINKILKSCMKVFPPDSKKADGTPADRSCFEPYDKLIRHYKLFESKLFNWETVSSELEGLATFLKFTSSKLLHPLDILYIDHKFLRQIFPVTLIQAYTSVVSRAYGTPIYDHALRIQTYLTENFIFHHLEPDIKYQPRVRAQDINLTDPIGRIRIRERNRNDKLLKQKYFSDEFNIKTFVNVLLENFFPNVTWRYVGGNQEMHRRTLTIILRLFELGLMEVDEMPEFTGLLLQKLENLLVLETVCYRDFETTLVSYPTFITKMKAYFYECKELVVSICIHVVILMNDTAFKESYVLFNKKKLHRGKNNRFDGREWSKAYFNNSEISNVLNRILTSYILYFSVSPLVDDRRNLFALINNFLMLVMDMKNDVYYNSTRIMTQPLIDYYFSDPHPSLKEEAVAYKNLFVMLIDEFAHIKTQEEVTANRMSAALKRFLVSLKHKSAEELQTYVFVLAEECMPTVLMAMNTLIVGKDLKKELQSLCMLAITEISKNNASCQAVLMNSDCMTHWLFLLDKSKILALNLLTKIFEFDCRLVFVDTDIFPTFMTQLRDLMWKHFSLAKEQTEKSASEATAEEKPPEPKNFDTWLKEFKDKVLTDNSESEGLFENLLIVFLFLRMMNNFVRKRDTVYEERFFSLTIQKLIAPCFIDIFLEIIIDHRFLKRAEEDNELKENVSVNLPSKHHISFNANFSKIDQPKFERGVSQEFEKIYEFTPKLSQDSSYEDLIELIEKKKNGKLSEAGLRGLLFEVAMYTMVLMVETCSGLYHYWIHKQLASSILPSFLTKTEYLMEIPNLGMTYRSVALQLYSCFAIFPGNSVLANRSSLNDTVGGTTNHEVRIRADHATGGIADTFIKELSFIDRVQTFLNDNDDIDTLEMVRRLYLRGIFPMVYKYLKGMYLCYTRNDKADDLLAKLKELMEAMKKVKPFLKTIGICPAESPFVREVLLSSIDSRCKDNLAVVKNKYYEEGSHMLSTKFDIEIDNQSRFNRPFDQTELISSKLADVRDLLEDIMNEIIYLYDHCLSEDDQIFFWNIDSKYVRPSSITATKTNPEPWNCNTDHTESKPTTRLINKYKRRQSIQINTSPESMINKIEMNARFGDFMDLMDSYQASKIVELTKPPSENSLLSFLSSSSSNNNNLIGFYGVLTQRLYEELFKEGNSTDREKVVPRDLSKPDTSNLYPLAKRINFNCTTGSLQSDKNIDAPLVTYLENDILNSIIRFLSNIMTGCEPIRRALFESASKIIIDPQEQPPGEMTEGEQKKVKPFEHNWIYNFLSIIPYIFGCLSSLSMNKTFHDYEYEIIRDREIELASFLKNLCENNYLPFKEYLGEMVPRVAGLPIYNAGNSTALYYIYCRADFMLAQVKYHLNKFPVLVSEDTFETFSIICRIFSITAEACTGPCVKNQLAVYKFRTDAIVGVLRRMIDDCDSSIYHAKTMAIEYMISLMDGGNETVILHFGRNMTFSQLFDLIIDHCKRLFIHIKFIKNKKRFMEMAAEARKHKLNKEKKETDLNINLGESKNKTGEDFDYYTYLHRVKTLDSEGASDRNLPTTITKEEESNDAKVDRRSIGLKKRMDRDLDDFYSNFGSRFVSSEILDYYKIQNYAEIMDLYIFSSEFSNHPILQIALKLNSFLINFSKRISGYNISMQNVYRSLIDHFGDEVPRYLHQDLGYYQRRKVNDAPSEKLIIYMFITRIISQVEICNPATRSNQIIYFQLIPKTFFLTSKTKSNFMSNADTEGMAIEMIQAYQSFSTEMSDNLSFYQRHPRIYKLTSDDAFHKFKIILWLLGLALNFLLVTFFRRDYDVISIEKIGRIAIVIIALMISCLSLLGSIGWFMSRYRQKVKLNRAQIEDEEKKLGRVDRFRLVKIYFWRSIIEESYMIIFMTHLLSNIFGLLFDPFFYTIQLMMIVFISTTANYVVKAITTHFKQLSLTMFLAILVMHSYSVLTAGHFWSYIDGNQPGQSGPLRCSYLWECLLFTVNQGLRNGGGISDSTMSLDSSDSESKYISKFFYDLIFFMLINVISLNIIFGIIIDTFAAMREANDQRSKLPAKVRLSA
jgi:hypothetical protein